MSEQSPLVEAQKKFQSALSAASSGAEIRQLLAARQCTLRHDVVAMEDSPPYPRAIVEGFLVQVGDTASASEATPVSFRIVGTVMPGDETCPTLRNGEALQVATGSLVPTGNYAVVRMWDAGEVTSNSFHVTRPFQPGFFIEAQGVDIKAGSILVKGGSVLGPTELGLLASMGLNEIEIARPPKVVIFSSGDEVVPHTAPLKPGKIRDCNSISLSAAISDAGGMPRFAGIMRDDFGAFVAAIKSALQDNDMIVISGGTAVGGRDFVSDLIREVGELIVDGVPMRSGRPLIAGVASGKPIVGVAGHPPEALRGFQLFGRLAVNSLLGRAEPLPADPVAPR